MATVPASVLVAGVLALAVPWPIGAQSSPPSRVATAARTEQAPVIDGRLEERSWSDAPVLGDFVQHEPFEGRPASERTEVRLLFDDEALYIGARLYDGNPGGIVVGERRRDASLDDTDAFRFVLDTYNDRQNAFVFGTTPAGIEYDGQLTREGAGGFGGGFRQQAGSGGGFNLNWDGSWEVATGVDSLGWVAEFRIPFATLRYRSGPDQIWGLNLARHIRRRNEQSFWAPVPRQFDLYRLSLAGTLHGIEVPARRTVQVTPYVLAQAQRVYVAPVGEGPASDASYDGELGGEAKIGLMPSLTLDVTYNTDFAQVEVDEQQINLTRFNLRFPEKRPFFLENAGLFATGSSGAVELFFSRRIGIGPANEPIPIVGGGRLTGKVGGLSVGLLNIQTDAVEAVQPSTNYTVARLLRELPNRSRAGVLFTNRAVTGGGNDRTYAADGRVGVGESVSFDAYGAATESAGGERDHAYSVRGEYTTRAWRASAGYREVGAAFDPAVGFLPRAGYRTYDAFALRHVRLPAVPWLRELRPHVAVNRFFDFDGFEESRQLHIDSHVEFANGAFFSPAFNHTLEGLREPFEVAPGVFVPRGTYEHWEAAWRFNTDESAPVSLNGGVDVGGFLSGTRRGGTLAVTARRGSTLTAVLRVNHNDIRLEQGDFETTLVGLRLAYAFTARIFAQSLVQYSNRAESWSGNVRFGWLNTAGTGLFLVYNQLQRAPSFDDVGRPLDQVFIVKFTRQFDVLR